MSGQGALPSSDEFFAAPPSVAGGAASPTTLPTADQFFAPQTQGEPAGNYTGAAHDSVWSSVYDSGAQILNKLGYGIEQKWGSEPLGLSPAQKGTLLKSLGQNADDQDKSFFHSVSGALMRPYTALEYNAITGGAEALDILGRSLRVGLQGSGEALQGAARQIQNAKTANPIESAENQIEATILGGTGEVLGAIPEGFGTEFAVPTHAAAMEARLESVNRARALGVVGEGEEGFHEVAPITPENVAAREQAAREADLSPTPAPSLAPDIHAVARQIEPETFEKYDAAATTRDQLREQIYKIGAERESSPEGIAAQAEMNDVLGGANASHIEDVFEPGTAIRNRLEVAQTRLDAALRSDTPEMAKMRSDMLDADYAMRDLTPQVAAAYRQAREMMPEPEVPAVEEGVKPGAEEHPKAEERPQATTQRVAPEATQTEPNQPRIIPQEMAGEVVTAPAEGTGEQKSGNTTPKKPLLYRGTIPGRDDGEHPFLSPAREVAEMYAGKDGVVTEHENNFQNVLEADNWMDAKKKLGLPKNTPMPELTKSAAKAGYDGLSFKTTNGQEFVRLKPEAAPLKITEVSKTPKTVRYGNMKPVVGTGETKARGLSEGVEAKAIENGLAENFGDLPEYRQVSMADQAEKARLITWGKDYEAAKDIAMGRKSAPKGVLPESVFVAVEKRALAEGDVETLRQLATGSRLATEATTMGQRIRTLGERDPASPTGAIQAVQAAREAVYAKRTGESATGAVERESANIKDEVRAAASTKADWSSFIKSIECG